MNEREKIMTCGILGGMGPFATIQFFKKIVEQTPAKKDWEHIRLLIDNAVHIPSRSRSILYNEKSPVPIMIESINNLAAIGADFVVVPCNSAHYFFYEVTPHINIEWISIVKVTSDYIKNNSYNKPLILGGYVTISKKIYNEFLPDAYYLPEKENNFFTEVIEEIKLKSNIKESTKLKIEKSLMEYQDRFDCIVLACTEFSLIADFFSKFDKPVIDSTDVYVKQTIKLSRGNENKSN